MPPDPVSRQAPAPIEGRRLKRALTALLGDSREQESGIAYVALEETYAAHNYHPLDVVIASGEGAWAGGSTARDGACLPGPVRAG